MPAFFDSTADAAEASEALRGLAHASRTFDQPAQMYGVIGDLSSGMRSLRQALDQIADVHERKAAHAFNDAGSHEAGVRDALATAEELRQAANLVDRAYDRLAEGFIAAGRIAWHPDPAVEEAVPSRWVSVVFLQGEEADRPLRILGELGHVDAVDFLAQWDYGDETTQAALEVGTSTTAWRGTNEGGDLRRLRAGREPARRLRLATAALHRRSRAQDANQSDPSSAGWTRVLVSYSSPGARAGRRATTKRDGSWFGRRNHGGQAARGWCVAEDRARLHRCSGGKSKGMEAPSSAAKLRRLHAEQRRPRSPLRGETEEERAGRRATVYLPAGDRVPTTPPGRSI